MPNILVSTFGNTWAIAAELVAIGNYKEMNLLSKNKSLKTFYDKHTELDKIYEIWLICTHDKKTNEALNDFNTWLSYFQDLPLPLVRLLGLEKLEDLTTELECRQMSDFIYRTVLKAREVVCDGQLILSLAGGRKTMSSDMQRAADLFGCNALIHVANNNFPVRSPDNFKAELAEDVANELFIVEVQKNTKYNFVVDITPRITSADYPIEYSRSNKPSLKLYNEINERLSNAESLHYNAYRFRTGQSNQTIFHGLQQLPPVTLHKLENERPDYEWLKLLPKTDLHCHFGGILDVDGLITVAKANSERIAFFEKRYPNFAEWVQKINTMVSLKLDNRLREYITDKDTLRNLFPEIPRPIPAAAFISAFANDSSYLERLIFHEYLNENKFRNITITNYEKLGDLQGSALLQSEASIKTACQYFLRYCTDHHIKYLELRCSPCNYTQGGLTEKEVVELMYEQLYLQPECDIRLIIIGSRHGDMEIFRRHVALTQQLIREEKYRHFIVGFDVAGNEASAKPSKLRKLLLPLLKECLHLTIHAGENQPVENVWEAVYELNTDRVGHGLTLIQNPELLQRFRDRNIVIELCPSSNFQICDFNNTDKPYPLRNYLKEGLKVTLNTDNPGISRTSITKEYFFMTQYAALTKLEVIQLLRNSLQGVFLPKNEKKQLIVRIEEELYHIISNENK